MTNTSTLAPRLRATLVALNVGGALIAAGFAAAGLARPSIAEPKSTAETRAFSDFWAASSAVRTWAVTAPLLIGLLTKRGPSPQILAAAGLVQLGDAALGLRQRNSFMAVAPAVMGSIHLISARYLPG